jgi:hypothetical protein
VHCREFTFAPLRVDVDEADGQVEAWQTFRGNEWDNRGERRDVPLELKATKRADYYQTRSEFSPASLLKNPMILIALVSLGVMVGIPYLVDNMDPEMRAEFEEQQKKQVAGVRNPQNALQNFDMAAWMASKTAKTPGGDTGGGGNTHQRGGG